MPSNHRQGIYWALGSAIGIATFVIPWKIASSLGDTRVNTLILLLAGAAFNSVFLAAQQRSIPRFRRFDVGFAIAIAVLTLLGNLASAEAIAHLSPSLFTLLQRSEVILVALLAWPLIGERIDRRFVLGAFIAGCGLIVMQDPFAGEGPGFEGTALALFSAICFGAMAVLTRKYIQRIQLVAVNALRLWLAVGLWFVFNGIPEALSEVSAEQAGYVCLAAFCGPFFGRLCMMTSAKYVEARITILATLAAPPLTLALAYVLLDDFPQLREIQGGLIMLVGISIPILLGSRASRRAASPASTLTSTPRNPRSRPHG